MPRLHVDRPISVRPTLGGRWTWTCLGLPTCAGSGRERSQAAAGDAGRDHLRTVHAPTAVQAVAA